MINGLTVELDSWIVQDGNYDNFEVGKNYKFALEFFPHTFWKSARQDLKCEQISQTHYNINAAVIYARDKVVVIDFGLKAYLEGHPDFRYQPGDFVSGKFSWNVDPFFYFEGLYQLDGMPPLIYEWCTEEILMNTAPWIQSTDDAGHKSMVRDDTKPSYKSISRTDAWKDDEGNADYLLQVQLINPEPVKRCAELR